MDSNGAPASIRYELSILRRAFRLAQLAGKAIRPPFPSLQVHNVRQGFFEREDFEAVRQHLPEYLKGPMTFAYLTGWGTPSEALTLEWKQVDFSAGTVRLEPGTTKNDEGRVFPFLVLPELAMLLRDQWDRTMELQFATGLAVRWVFHRKARPIKDFWKAWKIACKAAGVPSRIPHDFRRTAVRNLDRAGAPRSVAMKLTGHKTEMRVSGYAIVCESNLSEGLQKLARLHEGERKPRTVTVVRRSIGCRER